MLELHIGRLRFCFGFSFFLLLAVVCRWQAGSMLLFSFLAVSYTHLTLPTIA